MAQSSVAVTRGLQKNENMRPTQPAFTEQLKTSDSVGSAPYEGGAALSNNTVNGSKNEPRDSGQRLQVPATHSPPGKVQSQLRMGVGDTHGEGLNANRGHWIQVRSKWE